MIVRHRPKHNMPFGDAAKYGTLVLFANHTAGKTAVVDGSITETDARAQQVHRGRKPSVAVAHQAITLTSQRQPLRSLIRVV